MQGYVTPDCMHISRENRSFRYAKKKHNLENQGDLASMSSKHELQSNSEDRACMSKASTTQHTWMAYKLFIVS